MKKIFYATLFLSLLISCNEDEQNLKKQISELKVENEKLKVLLSSKTNQDIVNLQLQLNSETTKWKPNKNYKISGKFVRFEKLPLYDLYILGKNERKLIAKNLTDPNFEFDFKPELENDGVLRVIAQIKIGTNDIQQIGRLDYTVQKK